VAWLTTRGKDCHGPLKTAADELFEEAMPCRRLSSYKGQRHFPGHYWFATTGQHVGYEAAVHAALAGGRRLARHVPDFFVRHADGGVSVVDVKPKAAMSDQDRSVFSVMSEACAQVGSSRLGRSTTASSRRSKRC
jgi:hypothetical protein